MKRENAIFILDDGAKPAPMRKNQEKERERERKRERGGRDGEFTSLVALTRRFVTRASRACEKSRAKQQSPHARKH